MRCGMLGSLGGKEFRERALLLRSVGADTSIGEPRKACGTMEEERGVQERSQCPRKTWASRRHPNGNQVLLMTSRLLAKHFCFILKTDKISVPRSRGKHTGIKGVIRYTLSTSEKRHGLVYV